MPPRIDSLAEDLEPRQPLRTEEQDLWLAVIQTAIHEAYFASDHWLRNSDRTVDPDLSRGDARRFLTMSWGPWADSRALVCDHAGVDTELLASAYRNRLAAIKSASTTAEIVDFDDVLAKLIDNEKTMNRGDFDRALAGLESAA